MRQRRDFPDAATCSYLDPKVSSNGSPNVTQEPADDNERASDRANFAVVAVAVGLVALAVLLVHWFERETALQDCVWANHRNCAPIDTPSQ